MTEYLKLITNVHGCSISTSEEEEECSKDASPEPEYQYAEQECVWSACDYMFHKTIIGLLHQHEKWRRYRQWVLNRCISTGDIEMTNRIFSAVWLILVRRRKNIDSTSISRIGLYWGLVFGRVRVSVSLYINYYCLGFSQSYSRRRDERQTPEIAMNLD
jgi:hypothetical protein